MLIIVLNDSLGEELIPYFDYSGKKIFYQVKDNDVQNALIFIHGSGGNSNFWREQLNLNIDYNIYALDLPSHNKSDGFSEHSLELYVDVVRTFITTLDLKNIILSGHSLGGAVIQSYYFKYPSDFTALILIGTGGRLRVMPSIFDTVKNNFQEYIDGIDDAFYEKPPKKIIEDLKKEYLKTDPNVIYDDFKICDGFDTLDKTTSINIPCLILVGKEDIMTPVKYSEFFHKKINTSKLVIIEKAGHLVILERPKNVNNAIENFINNYF